MQFKAISDEQRIPDTTNGTVDIVAHTMTITCDRLKDVDFSSVYFEAHQQVLVLKNSSSHKPGRPARPEGLRDPRIRFGRPHPTSTTLFAVRSRTGPTAWCCCSRETWSAISTDDSILDGLAAQDPWTKIIGQPLTDEPYGLAISKQHPEFVRFVNAVLQQLRTDGQWKASYAHWLGNPVPNPPSAHYAG